MPGIVHWKAGSQMAPDTRKPRPQQPLTEFEFFSSLPPELRLIIWKYAMETTRRIVRINAQEVETLPAGLNLPLGIPRPSDSNLMNNGIWMRKAVIERLYAQRSPLPHQLLFVCKESHQLVLERYKFRWEYTPHSKRHWYKYIPQPNETWERPSVWDVRPFEIRRHFLAEEKVSQWMETTLMDLKNDIVYLGPEMGVLFTLAQLDIMARWFPFLPNIQYLCVTFEAIWKTWVIEKFSPNKPPYLTRFKGLKHLIVTLENWPLYLQIHPYSRDDFDQEKGRVGGAKAIMETNLERLEKEVPGWKRPELRIILDEKELQDI